MKKTLFHILVLCLFLTSSLMAQENTPKPTVDKRKNALSFSNGLQCKYREDVQGAIRNFEEALGFMPDDDASMYELSEQYVLANRMEDAFGMIKKAVALAPGNKWYKMRLGNFYRNFEMYEDLIALYAALTKEYPEDMDMLSEYIDVLLITEDYDKALKEIDLLEEQMGSNEAIDDQRLAIYQRLGNSKDLIAFLNEKIKSNPFNSRYYSILAQVYMKEGKEKDALKMFEKVKETNPEDPYVNVSLLEFYEKNGEKKKAFEELLAALRNKNLGFQVKNDIYGYWFTKAPETHETDEQAFLCGQALVETHPDQKLGYRALSAYYVHAENMAKVKELSETILSIDSADYQAWETLVYIDINMKSDAVYQHAYKALDYYPMHPLFNLLAGEDCMMKDKLEEAVSYLERGRRYCSDTAMLLVYDSHLGDLYHQQGNDEKAFAAYDRCLAGDPDHALVLNNYAYYLALKGERLDDALKMAERATELEPDNIYYLDTHAWVLYKLSRYAEAKQWMERCLKAGGDVSGSDLEHYGDILFRLGDKKAALEQWGRAQKVGGYSDKLEQKLKDGMLHE